MKKYATLILAVGAFAFFGCKDANCSCGSDCCESGSCSDDNCSCVCGK